MLRKVQNYMSNQLAFKDGGRTIMQNYINKNKALIKKIEKNPLMVYETKIPIGPVDAVLKGHTFGYLKILSSVVKLPFKMLGTAAGSLKEDSKVVSSVVKLPSKMLNGAKDSLIKDFKELRIYVKSESDLAGAALKARGRSDKIVKFWTGDITRGIKNIFKKLK